MKIGNLYKFDRIPPETFFFFEEQSFYHANYSSKIKLKIESDDIVLILDVTEDNSRYKVLRLSTNSVHTIFSLAGKYVEEIKE